SYKSLLHQVCAATCGSCTGGAVLPPAGTAPATPVDPSSGKCIDLAAQCGDWADRCDDKSYTKLLREVCASTCKACGKKPVLSPPSQPEVDLIDLSS
ncbi:hypothetical protein AAVH_23520, partial [Aphelenchoides avenae]